MYSLFNQENCTCSLVSFLLVSALNNACMQSFCIAEDTPSTSKLSRQECRFGMRCYRKNPAHFEEFEHSHCMYICIVIRLYLNFHKCNNIRVMPLSFFFVVPTFLYCLQ